MSIWSDHEENYGLEIRNNIIDTYEEQKDLPSGQYRGRLILNRLVHALYTLTDAGDAVICIGGNTDHPRGDDAPVQYPQ